MDVKRFYRPRTLNEALKRLAAAPERTKAVAGATDLLPQIQKGDLHPEYLVDLTALPEICQIAEVGDEIVIGAGVTIQELAESPLIVGQASVLAEAAASLGSLQIRNRATIGGNLARSSPAADCVCALVALHATLRLRSLAGDRSMPVTEFLVGPGRNAARPDELIVAVSFPRPRGRYGSHFIKLGRRKALVLAVVAVGAALELDDSGRVLRCGIALGSVGPTTLWAKAAEDLLVGQALTPELIAHAAARAGEAAKPISDVRGSAKYRKEMAPVLTRRALQESWERARG